MDDCYNLQLILMFALGDWGGPGKGGYAVNYLVELGRLFTKSSQIKKK
jgi:hypothetical protein